MKHFIFSIAMMGFILSCSSSNTNTQEMTKKNYKDDTSISETNLDGAWTIVYVKNVQEVKGTIPFTFNLKEKRYSSPAMCNTQFGMIKELLGRTLTFQQPASTMMMCEEDKMKFDSALASALESVTSYRFDTLNHVLLMDSTGKDVLELTRK